MGACTCSHRKPLKTIRANQQMGWPSRCHAPTACLLPCAYSLRLAPHQHAVAPQHHLPAQLLLRKRKVEQSEAAALQVLR